MSAGQTIVLNSERSRSDARRLVDVAPPGAVLNVREGKRTLAQNDRLWALLSAISRAKPDGRALTPDVWKAVFMNACGHAVQFETGLSGEPFPIGFRSSRLSKSQMVELQDFIEAFAAEKGIELSQENM